MRSCSGLRLIVIAVTLLRPVWAVNPMITRLRNAELSYTPRRTVDAAFSDQPLPSNELGLDRIHSLAVPPARFHSEAHFLDEMSTNETAYTVGLPSRCFHDGREGGARGLPQQSQDLVGFRGCVLARAWNGLELLDLVRAASGEFLPSIKAKRFRAAVQCGRRPPLTFPRVLLLRALVVFFGRGFSVAAGANQRRIAGLGERRRGVKQL
jgi:hypothetical protein